MPIETNAPKIGLSARVDMRPLRGLDLWSQGEGNATASAPAWTGKEGLFRDWIEALVGHGTELGINDDLADQWDADGGDPLTNPIYINSDGYFVIENDCGNGDVLTLEASSHNAVWGFPVGQTAIADGNTLVGGAYQAGFTGTLGSEPPYLTFTRDATASTFYVPTRVCHFSDPRLSVRTRSDGGDIDFSGYTPPSECIEALDNDGIDSVATSRRIRWAITTDPPVRIVRMVPSAMTDSLERLYWENDTIRQMLGFTGNEMLNLVSTARGDMIYQIAELPPWYLVCPSKTRSSLTPGTDVERTARMTRDNRVFYHTSKAMKRWSLTFRLDGPVDVDDQHRVWAEQTFAALASGYLCLFMRWGETRRMRLPREGGHSGIYTNDQDGYRGRVYVHLDADKTRIDWPDALMTSAPITLEMIVVKQETAGT